LRSFCLLTILFPLFLLQPLGCKSEEKVIPRNKIELNYIVYAQACNKGKITHCVRLADALYYGTNGIAKNIDKSKGFLFRACQQGHSDSCRSLEVRFTDGEIR
jgi:TPR repeat protein